MALSKTQTSVLQSMQNGVLIAIVSSAVGGRVVDAPRYFELIGASSITGILLGAIIGLVLAHKQS
jgi:hypothetical protein